MEEDNNIIAAGSVVWRRNLSDEVEVAFVHRIKYNDWSLPKGKREGDEPLIATAYRETVKKRDLQCALVHV